jgi:SHS2 domain-containing protein
MPVEAGYEAFEVTADVGVVARGRTLAETFEMAARGMYGVMVNLEGVQERESREVAIAASGPEQLIERWLLELLFLTESEGLLFCRFDVEIQDGRSLRARAYGEPVDIGRHELGPTVKAVTRHQLGVERVDGGFEARIIFDI